MNNIDFNEEYSFKSRSILGEPQKPKIIKLLISTGIVKDEKSAGVLLLTLVVIGIITTILIFYTNLKPEEVEYNLSPETIEALPDEIKAKIYESRNK